MPVFQEDDDYGFQPEARDRVRAMLAKEGSAIATGQAPGDTVPHNLTVTPRASEKSTMEKVSGFLTSAAGKAIIHGMAALADAVGENLTLRGQQGAKGGARAHVLALEKGAREQGEAQRKQQAEERKMQTEERVANMQELRYQLDVGKFLREGRKESLDSLESFMNLAGRIAATTADREVARTSLIGLANETGLTFAKELVPGILDNMDLAAKLGPAFKLISENPASGTFLMSARQAMQKPETARKALTDLLEFASAGAARKIIQWAPQYKGKSYDEFARAIGLENSYIKDVLNGVVPVDEATRKTIENVLATHGIQSPAAGARLVEKTGEQEALLPGKIKEQEALIPGKVKEQEALLPGQLKKSEELEKIKKKYDVEKPASESDIRGMRQEFTQLSKPFIEVRDTHGRIQAARKDPSAAGDLALIFNFMKMLDPASVVREGEFATAQDAAGVPDRVIAKYNALLKGERLTEATRTDFVKRADALYQSQLESQKKLEKEFRRIAKRRNIDPEDIIVDLKSEEMTSGGPVIKFVRDPKTGQLIPSQ